MRYLICFVFTLIILQNSAINSSIIRGVYKRTECVKKEYAYKGWFIFREIDWKKTKCLKTSPAIQIDIPKREDIWLYYETEKERDNDFNRIVKNKRGKE